MVSTLSIIPTRTDSSETNRVRLHRIETVRSSPLVRVEAIRIAPNFLVRVESNRIPFNRIESTPTNAHCSSLHRIYDDHAWEKDVTDVHEDIKQLLRFCLQRPSHCGLLGRDAITADNSTGTIPLPVVSAVGTKGIAKLYSERRQQSKPQKPSGSSLRLPWGGCTLIPTHGGRKFSE